MNKESERVASIARSQLGVSEGHGPAGWNNRVRYTVGTKWFGQPWCLWFVVWVARRAGIGPDRCPTIGSCRLLQAWARRHGRWSDWPDRLPAVVLLNSRAGAKTPVHCGLVVGIGPDALATVEGNVARPGQSQGSVVASMSRPRSRVVGSVYIGR